MNWGVSILQEMQSATGKVKKMESNTKKKSQLKLTEEAANELVIALDHLSIHWKSTFSHAFSIIDAKIHELRVSLEKKRG